MGERSGFGSMSELQGYHAFSSGKGRSTLRILRVARNCSIHRNEGAVSSRKSTTIQSAGGAGARVDAKMVWLAMVCTEPAEGVRADRHGAWRLPAILDLR